MKRIGLIALLHESNTFIDRPTRLTDFEDNLLVTGQKVIDVFRNTEHEVAGFIDGLEASSSVEVVGVFAARAMPFGTIERSCWEDLMSMLAESVQRSGVLDGYLVAPHGATVAEGTSDADGEWLGLLRSWIGPDIPVFGTLDLHANVSQRMVDHCHGLFGYQTNPHLDQRERGREASQWMLRYFQLGRLPKMHLAQTRLCMNIERQASAEPHLRRLRQKMDHLISECSSRLSLSCLYGFPYADVDEMGTSVIAVSEESAEVARSSAQAVASWIWAEREQYRGQLLGIDEAIRSSLGLRDAEPTKPVGLLEMGDNVGGGSPGDGTWIIHRWREVGQGPMLSVLYDPEVVRQAKERGVGDSLVTSLGGKVDPTRHGPPIDGRFTILGFSHGRFRESGTTHGGYRDFDQGPTVVLQDVKGSTYVVSSRRMAPLSIQQIVCHGIDPSQFASINIKGVHAPVAAYQGVCSQLIRVDTPGVTSADLSRFEYHRRRRPLYPFEE